MNTILVSSHRRSGTHFLIDSLRKNISDAEFPNHRHLPADFNLGSLYSKSEKVYSVFTKLINTGKPVIIKSHLLPEECHLASPRDKHEELIKEIFIRSKKMYIARDGKDVLMSLYKYLKPVCSFSEFIRESNDHIIKELRSAQEFDSNRVAYWSYHINQWRLEETVKQIHFSDLMNNFKPTMSDILEFFDYPLPKTIERPAIPRNILWHGIQKKLNHFGLAPLPESSSVQPNKVKKLPKRTYFSDIDDEYYLKHNKVK